MLPRSGFPIKGMETVLLWLLLDLWSPDTSSSALKTPHFTARRFHNRVGHLNWVYQGCNKTPTRPPTQWGDKGGRVCAGGNSSELTVSRWTSDTNLTWLVSVCICEQTKKFVPAR